MSQEARVYLQDILESIQKIQDYTSGINFVKFAKDAEMQDAVMRRLEIIGEAVKNISPELKNHYQDIPWKKIAGMRDVLIHEYAGVLLDRVWQAVERDLPDLKSKIETVSKELL